LTQGGRRLGSFLVVAVCNAVGVLELVEEVLDTIAQGIEQRIEGR
jgi:hypothetical protein